MASEVKTGYVPFTVGDKTYQTWYKIYGKLGEGRRPIVTLHGGVGMTHNYMLPHIELTTRLDVPVVFYDQIGNGQSTHLPDAPKEFWKVELFVDELDNLVKHLGISDDFDIIGNSWGGMLGAQYAGTRIPPGLKNLVISNSAASVSLMMEGLKPLVAKHPEHAEALRKHHEAGTYESPEYQAAVAALHELYFCRLDPKPKDFMDSILAVIEDPTVFRAMVGPSVYHITANVAQLSLIENLPNIPCPTLVISSPHDIMQPSSIFPLFQGINKVKWVELQNSTHVPMFEEPERYFDVLEAFLGRE